MLREGYLQAIKTESGHYGHFYAPQKQPINACTRCAERRNVVIHRAKDCAATLISEGAAHGASSMSSPELIHWSKETAPAASSPAANSTVVAELLDRTWSRSYIIGAKNIFAASGPSSTSFKPLSTTTTSPRQTVPSPCAVPSMPAARDIWQLCPRACGAGAHSAADSSACLTPNADLLLGVKLAASETEGNGLHARRPPPLDPKSLQQNPQCKINFFKNGKGCTSSHSGSLSETEAFNFATARSACFHDVPSAPKLSRLEDIRTQHQREDTSRGSAFSISRWIFQCSPSVIHGELASSSAISSAPNSVQIKSAACTPNNRQSQSIKPFSACKDSMRSHNDLSDIMPPSENENHNNRHQPENWQERRISVSSGPHTTAVNIYKSVSDSQSLSSSLAVRCTATRATQAVCRSSWKRILISGVLQGNLRAKKSIGCSIKCNSRANAQLESCQGRCASWHTEKQKHTPIDSCKIQQAFYPSLQKSPSELAKRLVRNYYIGNSAALMRRTKTGVTRKGDGLFESHLQESRPASPGRRKAGSTYKGVNRYSSCLKYRYNRAATSQDLQEKREEKCCAAQCQPAAAAQYAAESAMMSQPIFSKPHVLLCAAHTDMAADRKRRKKAAVADRDARNSIASDLAYINSVEKGKLDLFSGHKGGEDSEEQALAREEQSSSKQTSSASFASRGYNAIITTPAPLHNVVAPPGCIIDVRTKGAAVEASGRAPSMITWRADHTKKTINTGYVRRYNKMSFAMHHSPEPQTLVRDKRHQKMKYKQENCIPRCKFPNASVAGAAPANAGLRRFCVAPPGCYIDTTMKGAALDASGRPIRVTTHLNYRLKGSIKFRKPEQFNSVSVATGSGSRTQHSLQGREVYEAISNKLIRPADESASRSPLAVARRSSSGALPRRLADGPTKSVAESIRMHPTNPILFGCPINAQTKNAAKCIEITPSQ